MTSRRVRMIDVADAAGVSRTTASFVLNGRDAAIPEETRKRVLHAARQLGYRPNAAARALATGRTHRIGIVLNEPESFAIHDAYFSNVLAGVTRGALRHNYNLLLYSAHYPDWRALYAEILTGAADGTLLIGRYAHDELAPALLNKEHPAVCISFQADHPSCYSVDCDNQAGAAMAVRHLIALGHRRIALLGPSDALSWGRERRLGALQALREADIPEENLQLVEWAEEGVSPFVWIETAIQALLSARPRVTAIVCCDELRARTLVERLPKYDCRIPDDFAVIGFNSTELSERTRPPVTSVWQPLQEIGEAAVEMLVNLLEERDVPERIQRFPMRLDVRESCGAAARKYAAVTDRIPERELTADR